MPYLIIDDVGDCVLLPGGLLDVRQLEDGVHQLRLAGLQTLSELAGHRAGGDTVHLPHVQTVTEGCKVRKIKVSKL